MADELLIEVSDAIATLTLNRPEQRNSLSAELVDGLIEALARFAKDDGVRALTALLVRLGREAVNTAADMEFKQSLHYLHGQLSVNAALDDAVKGVSAFLERRAPQWRGR